MNSFEVELQALIDKWVEQGTDKGDILADLEDAIAGLEAGENDGDEAE